VESHPTIDPEILEDILPKKVPLVQFKAGSNLILYCRVPFLLEEAQDSTSRSTGQQPIFFQHRDGPILPSLRFVHQFPDLGWTSVTVDKGAIPYILGGANIMCPGLTNPGGVLPDLEANRGVIIMAEGKQHAIAVGTTKMSAQEIRSKNKGIGIEVAHYLGDGLFQTSVII
jgi:PUA domain protein